MYTYINTLLCLCQQKVYDKKPHITTEINIPTISAIRADTKTNLIFFIPTQLVYIAIVYKVVSVDPIIVDAIKPILLSTPYIVIISVATAIDALPDIGLINIKGNISLGHFIIFVIGEIKFAIKSIIPELLIAPTAKKTPINVGNIL